MVKDCTNGDNIDVKPFLNNMSFDIIGEVAFGYEFNSQTTVINPFVKSFREQMEGVLNFKAQILLKIFPFLNYLPFGPGKIIRDCTIASENVLAMVTSIFN